VLDSDLEINARLQGSVKPGEDLPVGGPGKLNRASVASAAG
jgi:hypothetical protein